MDHSYEQRYGGIACYYDGARRSSETCNRCTVSAFLDWHACLLTMRCSEGLVNKRKASRESLDHLTRVLNDLDELGDIMGEMLNMQGSVEVGLDTSTPVPNSWLAPRPNARNHSPP